MCGKRKPALPRDRVGKKILEWFTWESSVVQRCPPGGNKIMLLSRFSNMYIYESIFDDIDGVDTLNKRFEDIHNGELPYSHRRPRARPYHGRRSSACPWIQQLA